MIVSDPRRKSPGYRAGLCLLPLTLLSVTRKNSCLEVSSLVMTGLWLEVTTGLRLNLKCGCKGDVQEEDDILEHFSGRHETRIHVFHKRSNSYRGDEFSD